MWNSLLCCFCVAVVTTLAGGASAGSANGQGTNATFDGPSGVALDASGALYVADQFNMRIRAINVSTGGIYV